MTDRAPLLGLCLLFLAGCAGGTDPEVLPLPQAGLTYASVGEEALIVQPAFGGNGIELTLMLTVQRVNDDGSLNIELAPAEPIGEELDQDCGLPGDWRDVVLDEDGDFETDGRDFAIVLEGRGGQFPLYAANTVFSGTFDEAGDRIIEGRLEGEIDAEPWAQGFGTTLSDFCRFAPQFLGVCQPCETSNSTCLPFQADIAQMVLDPTLDEVGEPPDCGLPF